MQWTGPPKAGFSKRKRGKVQSLKICRTKVRGNVDTMHNQRLLIIENYREKKRALEILGNRERK